jgi:hypothetical protein
VTGMQEITLLISHYISKTWLIFGFLNIHNPLNIIITSYISC